MRLSNNDVVTRASPGDAPRLEHGGERIEAIPASTQRPRRPRHRRRSPYPDSAATAWPMPARAITPRSMTSCVAPAATCAAARPRCLPRRRPRRAMHSPVSPPQDQVNARRPATRPSPVSPTSVQPVATGTRHPASSRPGHRYFSPPAAPKRGRLSSSNFSRIRR